MKSEFIIKMNVNLVSCENENTENVKGFGPEVLITVHPH